MTWQPHRARDLIKSNPGHTHCHCVCGDSRWTCPWPAVGKGREGVTPLDMPLLVVGGRTGTPLGDLQDKVQGLRQGGLEPVSPGPQFPLDASCPSPQGKRGQLAALPDLLPDSHVVRRLERPLLGGPWQPGWVPHGESLWALLSAGWPVAPVLSQETTRDLGLSSTWESPQQCLGEPCLPPGKTHTAPGRTLSTTWTNPVASHMTFGRTPLSPWENPTQHLGEPQSEPGRGL